MNCSSKVRVTLSETELAAIKERLDAFLKNDEQKPLYTFLSGSVAEGLATPSSDYDVYAIYETCSEGETLLTGGSRPIEVTRISLSKIEHIVEMLLDGKDLPSMTSYELLLCHRLYCGIGLTNAHSFDQLKKVLDIDIFRKRLGDFCQLNAERSMRVSSGFVDAGDFDSAVLAARTASKHSFNQFLVFCGASLYWINGSYDMQSFLSVKHIWRWSALRMFSLANSAAPYAKKKSTSIGVIAFCRSCRITP